MTKDTKEFLLQLIKQELEEEEKCDMLEEHQDYIKQLLQAEKEILKSIYSKGFDVLVYQSWLSDDIERFLKKEETK